MALIYCPECNNSISDQAINCPHCGYPLQKPREMLVRVRRRPGFEWKSSTTIMGLPLVHVAFGWSKKTGRLMVARGIISIGWFAVGLITFAQFGVGLLFGFGQFMAGAVVVGQFALGGYFGLGQFATGVIAIGQFAFGEYVLCQIGWGQYMWTPQYADPEAVTKFHELWQWLRSGFSG